MRTKLTSKRFLLLLLYTPVGELVYNSPIEGRTRLQKMVFIFQEEILKDFQKDSSEKVEELLHFEGWLFGPFAKKLFYDLEFLVNQQFISAEVSSSTPLSSEFEEYQYWYQDMRNDSYEEYVQEKYLLTNEKGIPKAKELWDSITLNQQKMLIDFKTLLNRASLDKILSYVYKKYDGTKLIEKSIIREKYLP